MKERTLEGGHTPVTVACLGALSHSSAAAAQSASAQAFPGLLKMSVMMDDMAVGGDVGGSCWYCPPVVQMLRKTDIEWIGP